MNKNHDDFALPSLATRNYPIHLGSRALASELLLHRSLILHQLSERCLMLIVHLSLMLLI